MSIQNVSSKKIFKPGLYSSLQAFRKNLRFTPRPPVPGLVKHLTGLLFGDKGYIKSELFKDLYAKGLKLVTSIKKKMQNLPMIFFEKQMLKKRSIIETVFDYLKNKFEIEHSRHRSMTNFMVHILATLVTYSMKTTKPSIKYDNCLPAV